MNGKSLQPFGFGFEVNSHRAPLAFKTAIRRKWRSWLDSRTGPRGWMVGPVVYLWSSPTWLPGPSAVAVIRQQRTGTQVVGVAGFDLGGTVLAIAIGVGLPVLVILMGRLGFQLLWLPLICVVALLLRSGLHHEADPLVRFLERIAQPSGGQKRFHHLTLNVDGHDEPKAPTAKKLQAELEDLSEGGFLIISAASEIYMQVARIDGGFVLERRDGDSRSHFGAVYADGRTGPDGGTTASFSFYVTLKTLLAYAEAAEMPAIIGWRRLEL